MVGTAVGLEVGVVWLIANDLWGGSLLPAGLSIVRHSPARALLPNLRGPKSVVHLLWVANKEETADRDWLTILFPAPSGSWENHQRHATVILAAPSSGSAMCVLGPGAIPRTTDSTSRGVGFQQPGR